MEEIRSRQGRASNHDATMANSLEKKKLRRIEQSEKIENSFFEKSQSATTIASSQKLSSHFSAEIDSCQEKSSNDYVTMANSLENKKLHIMASTRVSEFLKIELDRVC